MHVMYVIDSMHGGGAETSLLEVVPALRRRGVVTSIVTVLADDGSLEERLDGLGLTRVRLKQRSSAGRVVQLRNLIRSQRPDLVHTTLFHANLIGRIRHERFPRP